MSFRRQSPRKVTIILRMVQSIPLRSHGTAGLYQNWSRVRLLLCEWAGLLLSNQITHIQVCHQNPLSTQDCPSCPIDVHGTSIGPPTITDQVFPLSYPCSPPVQSRSIGSPMDISPHRLGLFDCPFQFTCPMDIPPSQIRLVMNSPMCMVQVAPGVVYRPEELLNVQKFF